jgi:hypothetical protein
MRRRTNNDEQSRQTNELGKGGGGRKDEEQSRKTNELGKGGVGRRKDEGWSRKTNE